MKRCSFFFFIIYLVTACSNRDALPKGVLSKKQMGEVLWDMTRAGEFLNGFVFSKDSSIERVARSHIWYDKIFQIHKISRDQFYKSYLYYQDHPVLLREVLDSIGKKPVTAVLHEKPSEEPQVDTAIRRSGTAPVDTRIKVVDSIKKRRLLKKSLKSP